MELKDCIKKIRKQEIRGYNEIPVEYHTNADVIRITRNLGMRKTERCGYDIISKTFFVEEILLVTNYAGELVERNFLDNFADFHQYYEFMQGNIYDNACYYQYEFSQEDIKRYNLDTERLNRQSLLDYTIDDCHPDISPEERIKYDEIENQSKIHKKWIKKYNACMTYAELREVMCKHSRSKDCVIDGDFYLWNYINHYGKKSFKTIMKLVCENPYKCYGLENALCFLYGPEKVLKAYDYRAGTEATNKKHNDSFKEKIDKIVNTGVTTKTEKYFDKYTHYYCVQTNIYLDDAKANYPIARLYKYFETFKGFTEYLNNDLSDCDLSNDFDLKVDISGYKTNEGTKLPIGSLSNLRMTVVKKYNRYKQRFEVCLKWYDERNVEVFRKDISFDYFFEFVAFLKYDLSHADLLFCDGLKNVSDFSQLNMREARLQSCIAEKAGLEIERCDLPAIQNFNNVQENEEETALVLKNDRTEQSGYEQNDGEQKVYYITDLHIMHRLQHAKCKTYEDCVYVMQSIIDDIFTEEIRGKILLIGGDVASDFSVYRIFIKMIRNTIDRNHLYVKVVFVLGNHEMWDFQGETMDEIVEKYRRILSENGMYLLQNEILYQDENNSLLFVPQQEIDVLTDIELRERLRKARTLFVGGVGFSAYNEEFNADNGVYRKTLSREEEKHEGSVFEALYDRVCSCLSDKNIIVLTHMPFEDWCKNKSHQEGFVYVSGHNHRNYFYDDGVIRVYADNQVGYKSESMHLKYLYIYNTYDWFSDYEDGIHQITREDYINFHRGNRITITFNREINKLYMLKRNGYYCFIHQNRSNKLSILNGGSLKSLSYKDIQWYYDNMDAEIAFIKKPLEKYQNIQLKLAEEIKKIGGWGSIHGAIVDIDFYNHIYVNPHDLKVTPYFAYDMVMKYAYQSVPALLKSKCPLLYMNYTKLLADKNSEAMVIRTEGSELSVKPELYKATDIYSASR
ncbi:MAG: metallophosphoesterase [Oscillospiraceae bacterium]|nr:metallophosphoesterase [Oscillospiraceae bacterium]